MAMLMMKMQVFNGHFSGVIIHMAHPHEVQVVTQTH